MKIIEAQALTGARWYLIGYTILPGFTSLLFYVGGQRPYITLALVGVSLHPSKGSRTLLKDARGKGDALDDVKMRRSGKCLVDVWLE